MARFNFVISQNAKWGHAGFYIDCHRMTVPENILLQKKLCVGLQGTLLNRCTLFALDIKVSVSAVFCLDILQL